MNRNELQKCRETLDNYKTWECICNNVAAVESFVSMAYDGIDFDTNFELHQMATALGPMVSVRKK